MLKYLFHNKLQETKRTSIVQEEYEDNMNLLVRLSTNLIKYYRSSGNSYSIVVT